MIIEHGRWDYYTPATPKEGMPPQVMYAQRVGDGMDWYDYVASKPFGDTSVVVTVYPMQDGTEITQAATFDYTAIFPPKARLLEMTDYVGSDPQADLGQRIYDPATLTIGDKYAPPPPPPTRTEQKILTTLDAIIERLEKLEKK